jgi:hypothetical protein
MMLGSNAFMDKKPLLRRVLTVETLSSGVLGAAAPYLVAGFVRIAPTRVPLWLVLASIVGCAVLAHGGRVLYGRHRRNQQRLDRLERTMAEIAPGRLPRATARKAHSHARSTVRPDADP